MLASDTAIERTIRYEPLGTTATRIADLAEITESAVTITAAHLRAVYPIALVDVSLEVGNICGEYSPRSVYRLDR